MTLQLSFSCYETANKCTCVSIEVPHKIKHDVTGGIPLKKLLQWVKFGPGNQIHLIWDPVLPITWKIIIVKCQCWIQTQLYFKL